MDQQTGVLDILAQFFHRLWHWGPLVALLIVKFIFLTCLYVTSMWLSPYNSLEGTVNHAIYIGWVGTLLYNFFMAVAMGPGFVPLRWRPVSSFRRRASVSEGSTYIAAVDCLPSAYLFRWFDGPRSLLYRTQELPEDEQFLQYCANCDGFKTPRSHHCRRCER